MGCRQPKRPHRLPQAAVLLCGLGGMTGCLFPNDPVTGLELSWFTGEANGVDGPPDQPGSEESGSESGDGGNPGLQDSGRRVRTCVGGLYSRVEFTITDLDSEDRQRRFGYDCERGFLTPEQFLVQASPIFVELHPGTYEIEIEAIDDPASRGEQGEIKRVSGGFERIRVNDAGPTFLQWEVIPTQGKLSLSFEGECAFVSVRMAYARPAEQLAAFAFGTDEPEEMLRYRDALTANTGLPLHGAPANCEGLTGLTHVLEDIDRGDYTLWVGIDDAPPCPVDLRIANPETALTLDLATLGCAP